jgi:UDP-3-O-[3-hydroxymyristoyl] glucosamine N-acyltransferase
VVVKNNTTIYAGVKIYADCEIGESCILHAGCVIGADGFGFAPTSDGSYRKVPQVGNVIIEDNVEIGANTTIDCATMGSTIIHKGVKLDNLIQIAHNCELGENTVMAALSGLAGSVKVGKNCTFAGQVGVAGHLTIGNHVTFGAMSGITNNVKNDKVMLGAPAMDISQAAKVLVVYRRLPQLREHIINLEKELAALKEQIGLR